MPPTCCQRHAALYWVSVCAQLAGNTAANAAAAAVGETCATKRARMGTAIAMARAIEAAIHAQVIGPLMAEAEFDSRTAALTGHQGGRA